MPISRRIKSNGFKKQHEGSNKCCDIHAYGTPLSVLIRHESGNVIKTFPVDELQIDKLTCRHEGALSR